MKNFVLLLSSFVVGTVFYNCSTTDVDPVRISGQWTLTAIATKDSCDAAGDDVDEATRGIFIGGATYKRYVPLWDKYDSVWVYKAGKKTADAFLGTLKPKTQDVRTTELSGKLSGDVSEGDVLDFYLLGTDRDYTGQDGGITGFTKYNYMYSQLRINSISGTTVTTTPVEMAGREHYLRLRFYDNDGIRLPIEQLIIHSTSGQILLREPLVPTADDPIVHGDLVVNPVKEDGGYPVEIYVCMHNDLVGTKDGYTFTVKSGGYYYVSNNVLNYEFVDNKYTVLARRTSIQGPAPRITTTTTVDGFEDGGGDNDGNIKY